MKKLTKRFAALGASASNTSYWGVYNAGNLHTEENKQVTGLKATTDDALDFNETSYTDSKKNAYVVCNIQSNLKKNKNETVVLNSVAKTGSIAFVSNWSAISPKGTCTYTVKLYNYSTPPVSISGSAS